MQVFFGENGSYHHNTGAYDQNKHAYLNLRHLMGLGQHALLFWGLTQPPTQIHTLSFGNLAFFGGAPNQREMERHSAGWLVLARIAFEWQTVNAGLLVKPMGAPRPFGGSAGAPRGSGI